MGITKRSIFALAIAIITLCTAGCADNDEQIIESGEETLQTSAAESEAAPAKAETAESAKYADTQTTAVQTTAKRTVTEQTSTEPQTETHQKTHMDESYNLERMPPYSRPDISGEELYSVPQEIIDMGEISGYLDGSTIQGCSADYEHNCFMYWHIKLVTDYGEVYLYTKYGSASHPYSHSLFGEYNELCTGHMSCRLIIPEEIEHSPDEEFCIGDRVTVRLGEDGSTVYIAHESGGDTACENADY